MLQEHAAIEQRLVKENSTYARIRRTNKIAMIGMVGLAALFVISGLGGLFHIFKAFAPPFFAFFYIFMGVYFFVIAAIMRKRQLGFWKKQEQRRQRAVQGDQSLLADEQPKANANALSLPVTIGQRPTWKPFLLMAGILLLFVLVVMGVFLAFISGILLALPAHHALTYTFYLSIIAPVLLVTLCISGIVGVVAYSKARQQITVTEDGIHLVGLGSRIHSVSWQEARLFAIDNLKYGTKTPASSALFELSSANDIVQWFWIRKNGRGVLFLSQPTLPIVEYDQQMQALLSLIAARTGQPLYDLRKESASEKNVQKQV